MLLFYCADHDELDVLSRAGVRSTDAAPVRLWTSFEAIRAACEGAIVVVDGTWLSGIDAVPGEPQVLVQRLPADAFENLDPYRPPQPVVAGGGYVVRAGADEPEVLMIFRRGVWDLPKGKQDPGETVEACALRETREEVGVDALTLRQALGTTVHCYEEDGQFLVKTTYWYLMSTDETDFEPQHEEDIVEVAWKPWTKARRCVGYESLREHMARVEHVVLEDGGDVPGPR